jgi:uncharacterized phage-associated protein
MGNGKFALHPTSAITLSNFFIDKANPEKDVPTLDQIKLQKLLYFAYAW